MFKEINRINSYGETQKALIKVEDIVGIKENHVETEKLYDEGGNLVSETPRPRDFTLKLVDGMTYHIDETQYQDLVDLLTNTNTTSNE